MRVGKRATVTLAKPAMRSEENSQIAMNKKYFLILALIAVTTVARGQGTTPATPSQADPSITANRVIGEVKAIDAAANQMIVKTDAGSVVTVVLADKTIYMRLAPGEKTLTNATKITLADVAEGDRVWSRGKVSEDRKSVPANRVGSNRRLPTYRLNFDLNIADRIFQAGRLEIQRSQTSAQKT